METLILDDKRAIEVTEDAYWRYNRLVDERNAARCGATRGRTTTTGPSTAARPRRTRSTGRKCGACCGTGFRRPRHPLTGISLVPHPL